MNQLFRQQPNTNSLLNNVPQNQLSQMQVMSQLLQFIRTTSPQQAKSQVERLVKERGISQQEFDDIKKQASEIAKALGVS